MVVDMKVFFRSFLRKTSACIGLSEYCKGTGWANVECRTYEFIQQNDNLEKKNDASMQETMESRQRRGKFDSRPTADGQTELCNMMLHDWAKQGYPINPAK